jgi:aspartokinase-like uncharacterized kinase
VPVLLSSERPLLIVPGGGPFADAVRQAQVPDDTAHWMAVAAMDQYGWLCASHGLPVTDRLTVPGRTAVFLPYRSLREHDPLPHSWDVTSDSIAAWVAAILSLELLLLKSADSVNIDGVIRTRGTKTPVADTVDPFFIPFVRKHKIKTTIINGSVPGRITKFLHGRKVPCTKIGTTFF